MNGPLMRLLTKRLAKSPIFLQTWRHKTSFKAFLKSYFCGQFKLEDFVVVPYLVLKHGGKNELFMILHNRGVCLCAMVLGTNKISTVSLLAERC